MTEDSPVLAGASPEARQLYRSLLAALRPLGEFREEAKKTSVHLCRETAFAGVQFRRAWLIVTLKATERIDSARVHKAEQVSKNRWHCEVKLAREADVDAELKRWLRAAYDLSG